MPIFPLVAPRGTLVEIVVSFSTANTITGVPLKVTCVAPLNLVPVIVTGVPTVPMAGVNPVITGGVVTLKSLALEAVPAVLLMLILPVVAPLGTVVLIWEAET